MSDAPPALGVERPVVVVGLGYVGLVLAIAMARAGRRTIGVEAQADRRRLVQAGIAPFFEPGLEEALCGLPDGRLTVADRVGGGAQAVVICVGTGVDAGSREPDLTSLVAAADEVGNQLSDDTLVVVRSTVPVGTTRNVVLPRLRRHVASPLLAFCPERTVQGCALEELPSLPQVIAGLDGCAAHRAQALFAPVTADQVVVSSLEAAEMVKLVCNAHTDTLYAFGNEVARMASALELDADEVISCANVGYPRPDLARPGYVGGSCLTKDPYLLMHSSTRAGYRPALVAAARRINEDVPGLVAERVLRELAALGRDPARARILVCGMAYKGRPETDDVRGAASVEVAHRLRGRVAALLGHDFVVAPERIARLGFEPVGLEDGVRGADVLVLLVDHPGYRALDAAGLWASMPPPVVVFDVWGLLRDRLEATQGVRYLRLGRC